MEQPNQLDSTMISELFKDSVKDSTTSLIPESLVTTITTGFLVLTVLGALFLVLYLFSIIRKWRVDSAILHMQKDVAEIKSQLVASTAKRANSIPAQEQTDKTADKA